MLADLRLGALGQPAISGNKLGARSSSMVMRGRGCLIAIACTSFGCLAPHGAELEHEAGEHDEEASEGERVPAPSAGEPGQGGTPLEIYMREVQEYERRVGIEPPDDVASRRKHRDELRKIRRACARGVHAADEELAHDQLGHAHFGLPADCFDRYARAAYERLGIGHHWMGCVMADDNSAFASCYNTVMDREIAARHGAGALDRLWAELCVER